MGGRGDFSHSLGRTGGIPFGNRKYKLVGWLGNTKVIECVEFSNNPTPTYSNTANTTYFSYSKEHQKIEHVYFYRNHKLVKSIDLNQGEPHVHYWNAGVVGRKSHDKHNRLPLTPRDKRLVAMAQAFNNTKKNGK